MANPVLHDTMTRVLPVDLKFWANHTDARANRAPVSADRNDDTAV